MITRACQTRSAVPIVVLGAAVLTVLSGSAPAGAQGRGRATLQPVPVPSAQAAPAPDETAPPTRPIAGPDYLIGAGDLLSVSVLQVPELKTSVRVSEAGVISLPLVGILPAAGLTLTALEARLAQELTRTYVRNPQVSVQVTEMQSHPVSVVGAVGEPGMYQLRRPTPLLEVLSLAKGISETAGDRVLVVRGGDDHGAGSDASGTTTVQLADLLDSGDPRANILVRPGDAVKVPSAAIVYVVGEVNKPGAYPMPRGGTLTVLRALALGQGLTPIANKKDAVILRTNADGVQAEVEIPLQRIIDAKTSDPRLSPNDVLFIPGSGGKAATRAALSALSRLVSLRPF